MSSGPQGRGCLGGGATDGHVLARGGAGRPRVSWRLTSLCGRLQTARTAASQLPRLSRVVVGVASAAAAAATAMAQYKGAASEAGRAMHLMKKREKQREQMEQMKQRIAEENIMKSNIDKKFSAHYDAVEAELKSSTVGLVTLNDMKAKQEALVKEREKQLAKKEQSKELQLWVLSSPPAALLLRCS